MRFVPNRSNHGWPFESIVMPYGRQSFSGIFTTRICPVLGFMRVTALPNCAVNQRSPFGANVIVCGSRTALSGTG